MRYTLGKAIKSLAVVTVATLIGASSTTGAVAGAPHSPTSGQSSAVGSYGYASAYVTYARAYVTEPAGQTGDDASGAVADAGTDASPATDRPTVVAAPASSGSDSSAPTVKIVTPEKLTVPDVTTTDALPASAVDQISNITLPPELTIPPILTLPPVQGVEVIAALLLLLTTTQTSTVGVLAASETVTLAAIEHARAQAVLAFADADMPDQEALVMANIDEARDRAIEAYAQATTATIDAFGQARTVVLGTDPAKFNGTPGEVVALINSLRLLIQQKLAEAQQQLLEVAAQFA